MPAAFVLVACSPALDWRESRPPDSDVVALFPCRPQPFARQLALAGETVQMHLISCSAGKATYAIAYAPLADPAKVTAALTQLRDAAAANIGAAPAVASPWSLPGMTPHPLAQKLLVEGRGADGKAVREQAVFFVKGLRVYQATIVGTVIDAEAAETFFNGLKLAS